MVERFMRFDDATAPPGKEALVSLRFSISRIGF
jgi:hypothetical protein